MRVLPIMQTSSGACIVKVDAGVAFSGAVMRVWFVILLAFALGGCATLSKDESQTIDVRVFDLDGHQVDATCRLTNGSQVMVGNAPLFRVPVPRSGSDLIIECARPGMAVARAVAVSRSSGAWSVVFQPFATTVIDHLTGRIYDYPVQMDLVLGRELRFDRRSADARPVEAKAIPVSQMASAPAATTVK